MSGQGSLVAELVNEMRQPNNGAVPGMPLQPGMMPPGMGGGGMQPGMPQQGMGGMQPGMRIPQQGMGGGMQPGMGMPQQGMPQQGMQMPSQQGQMGGMAPIPPQHEQQMQQGYDDDDEEYEMMQGHDMGRQQGQMDMNRFGMEEDKSYVDQFMDALKDPLIIGALFMILSLPQLDRFLVQTLPVIGSNLYYTLGLKSVLMGVLFYVVRYVLG